MVNKYSKQPQLRDMLHAQGAGNKWIQLQPQLLVGASAQSTLVCRPSCGHSGMQPSPSPPPSPGQESKPCENPCSARNAHHAAAAPCVLESGTSLKSLLACSHLPCANKFSLPCCLLASRRSAASKHRKKIWQAYHTQACQGEGCAQW